MIENRPDPGAVTGPASAYAHSRLPLYDQVASDLRQRISAGEWAPGDRIPSLEDLAERFGVARVTVRQAIGLLEQEGLIWRRQGKGTFVTRRPSNDRWLPVGTEWSSLLRMIDGTRMRLIETMEVERPEPLRPEDGTPAACYQRIHRIHTRDGRPYCEIDLFLASDIYALAPERFRERLVLETLNGMEQVAFGSAHQTLTVGRADMETARLLDMDVGGPVAEVRRVITDRSDRVIYVAAIVYRGDFVRLDIQLLGSKKDTIGGTGS